MTGFCYLNDFISYCKTRDREGLDVLSVDARDRQSAQGFFILKIVIKDLHGKLNSRNILCLLLAESCEISSIRKATAISRDAASAPIKSFNCGHYFKKKKNPTRQEGKGTQSEYTDSHIQQMGDSAIPEINLTALPD